MYELLMGVGYIHSRNIAHRDIKLENILLDNTGQVKLCDFGVSELLEDSNSLMKECCGTPIYMPPEVIEMDIKLVK